jgi:hypothetical protein
MGSKWRVTTKCNGTKFIKIKLMVKTIQYLHFQKDTLFHGTRLIILIVDVNILLSWGAQVDYSVSQKAKLMYHHKDYNAFAALIGSGLLDCIIF